jgi:hypothetical protein
MKPAAVVLLFALAAASCGPGDAPGSAGEESPPANGIAATESKATTSSPYARQYPDASVQGTYERAVDACFYDRPQKLASDLGVTNDPGEIAREFSMRSEGGPQRDAAYVGCLEGLSAPGAGEERPFRR